MITSAESARDRIRLILDRANSPWLTDSEINNFIEISINEYLRERVNQFGSNQKITDDFGKYVKSVTFSNEPVVEEESTSIFRKQFVNYNESGNYNSGDESNMEHDYPGGEWGMTPAAGTGCSVAPIGEGDPELHFGTLVEVKILQANNLRSCKVMSIDDALSASQDPFNQPGSFREFHAIRVEDIYWIRPGLTSSSYQAVLTFVSNDNSVENIVWLPVHGREEVCQISARKILGTVADERMSAADIEIKQLEGK